ncbi:sensor domain-containing diguanylate cyclase [Cognatiluteimonas profundi]|uniref:sensor domain-containing diguanylate cyclase n=1 Tax=Cognatiluteimonas profundi TaxID=2594501 RepID=UPI00131EA6D0|nr:sensor domain-containing diguanylate cyclase [Lysobacter profundi]
MLPNFPVAPPLTADRQARAARAAGWLGLAVATGGLLIFAGWAFDLPRLTTLFPGLVPTKANTAVCFVLLGTSLFLSARPQKHASGLALLLAIIAGAIGLLSLLEALLGWDAGIDQLLFVDPTFLPASPVAGLMAPITAVNFVLLAAAVCLLDVETRNGWRPANWLALLVAVNAFLTILGYVYGVEALYRFAALAAVALPTALLSLLAGVAVAIARPGSRFVRQVLGSDAAGVINRRLLPAALLVPAAIAWVYLQGERLGLYDGVFALALVATTDVVVFSLLVWWSTMGVRRMGVRTRVLAEANAWQEAILDSANLTVVATDPDGVIRTINAGVVDMLGYAPEELVGKATPVRFHDPEEVAARAEVLSRELGRPVTADFEAFVVKVRRGACDENDWTYVRKDGSRFPVRLSVTAMRDHRGNVTGYLGVGYDITLQRVAEEKLLLMAQSDSLTGLANRRRFEERLHEAIERSERSGAVLALVYLDLDYFKTINDTLGHQAGDSVLREFARRLSESVRTTDTVARMSGDEFVILVEALEHAEDVYAVADKIIEAMRAPFAVMDRQQVVTVSMGIAVRQAGETSSEQLLRRADAALYQTKAAGRGHYQLHA